jgi:hypothetical protein
MKKYENIICSYFRKMMPAIRAMEILWLMLETKRSHLGLWVLMGITAKVQTGERTVLHLICRLLPGKLSFDC